MKWKPPVSLATNHPGLMTQRDTHCLFCLCGWRATWSWASWRPLYVHHLRLAGQHLPEQINQLLSGMEPQSRVRSLPLPVKNVCTPCAGMNLSDVEEAAAPLLIRRCRRSLQTQPQTSTNTHRLSSRQNQSEQILKLKSSAYLHKTLCTTWRKVNWT